VRGGGLMQGSLDVYSLSYGENYYITLRWSGRRVGNGPGIDFAVFENGFGYPDSGQFMDQIIVEVSVDGVEWRALPFDYLADDESVYSTDPSLWFGFAGVSPVLYHAEDNPVDPLDPSVAGGDGFDLDALPGDDPVSSELRENGFVYVRLVTAPSQLNPDTGLPFVRDSLSNGADIDGIIGRYLVDHTD
ncbi:MAG: LIC_13355 family lipoprotein, partial [Myxococcota bacterium]